MSSATEQLQGLIDQLIANKCSLEDFKNKALFLAYLGADLMAKGKINTNDTVLHQLVLRNKAGINDKEIAVITGLNQELVHAKSNGGLTPLQSLINALVANSCALDDFKRTVLILAYSGADLTLKGSSKSGDTVLHQLVLSNKAGINDKEIIELVQLNKDLVEAKNGYVLTPLQSLINAQVRDNCTLDDFKRTVLILAKLGADLGLKGSIRSRDTAFHRLVSRNKGGINDKEIAELLEIKKDFFNVRNGFGRLPLHTLIRNNPQTSVEEVERLIQLGADLHSREQHGATLLHAASISGNLAVAQFLVAKGLSLQTLATEDETMLHLSAEHQNQDFWQWLIENKIPVDAQNNSLQTALHLAAMNNNHIMVEWLIQHKAHTEAQDINGKRPLSYAVKYKAKETIAILAKVTSSESKDLVQLIGIESMPKQSVLSTLTAIQSEQSTAQGNELKNLKQAQNRLFDSIKDMKKYGLHLYKQGASKGLVAIRLANMLEKKAKTFFGQKSEKSNIFNFKEEFMKLLNSKNDEMREYRISWDTIAKNIAIALTIIGALLLVGKLIYSKVTEGRSLFFFQKKQTSCEEKIEAVKDCILTLG